MFDWQKWFSHNNVHRTVKNKKYARHYDAGLLKENPISFFKERFSPRRVACGDPTSGNDR
jgi:hypothetical protein